MVKRKFNTLSYLAKMSIRNIKQNVMQFISIIAIGAIAMTLFVGLLANADVFQAQVDDVYSQGNLASIYVTCQTYDKDDYSSLSSFLDEGDEIDSRYYLPATLNSYSIYLTVVHSLPSISKPYGEIETSEENSETDFLYVDNDLKNTSGSFQSDLYSLGDEITFSMDISSYSFEKYTSFIESFLKDKNKNPLTSDKISLTSNVTGFMSYPENITKASYNSSVVLISDSLFRKSIDKFIREYFKEESLVTVYSLFSVFLGFNEYESEYLTNPNQYLIKTKDSNIDALKDKIENYYENKGINNLYLLTSKDNMPFYVTIDNDVTQARQFTFVFPMVFFLVAVLVILTTLSQLVVKDRKNIGTLKAIGVSKSQIMSQYLFTTGTLVLLGIIIGLIIGPLLIPNILGQKYLIIYSLPTPKYHFPVWQGLLASFLFLAVSLLVTYLICKKEVSLKPSESMRPPVSKIKASSNSKNTKPAFFSIQMARRNILMNKVKSIMVVIGVLGCTALLVCGFGIEDTVNHGISHDMSYFHSEDIALSFSSNKSYDELNEDIMSIEGVESFEPSLTSSTNVYIDDGPQMDTMIYVIPDTSIYKKIDFDVNSVAISEKVARNTETKEGDYINFTFKSVTYNMKVSLVYEAFFYNGIMVHEGNEQFASLSNFTYSAASVKLKDNYSPDTVKKDFEVLTYISYARTQQDWKDNVNNVMSGVLVMTNAVKIFAILLGVVVLYNLTLMNFKDRTRDIATLKVLGFSRFEILNSLLFESLILTFIGVVLGMLVGYPFLLAVMMTNVVALVEYLYIIYPLTYVYAFLLTFVVAVVINLILSHHIKKVKMIESLKSVE